MTSNDVGGITGQDPAVYEGEYTYWPWARLIACTERWIETHAPHSATVVDYMCGTGFLLSRTRVARPDLACFGCDLDPAFIDYGLGRYRGLQLTAQSVFDFVPPRHPDVIICTGGLHHLPRDRRPAFLRKCAEELSFDGRILIGEEVIGEHTGRGSRRAAVLKLYFAMLEHIIAAEAPSEVLGSATTAMRKELLEDGTSKDSLSELRVMLGQGLVVEDLMRTWPVEPQQYGDYLAVCRRTSGASRDSADPDQTIASRMIPGSRQPGALH